MGEILKLLQGLGVDKSFFVMAAIFIFTYFLMRIIAINDLCQRLVARDRGTEGREHEVLNLQEKLQKNKEELSVELNKARASANQKFAEIKEAALARQRELIMVAKTKANEELQKVQGEIESKMKIEVEQCKKEVPLLAEKIMGAILGQGVSSQKDVGVMRT